MFLKKPSYLVRNVRTHMVSDTPGAWTVLLVCLKSQLARLSIFRERLRTASRSLPDAEIMHIDALVWSVKPRCCIIHRENLWVPERKHLLGTTFVLYSPLVEHHSEHQDISKRLKKMKY